MKKILIILFACSPLLIIGQSKGDFLLKLNSGMVYDSNHTKHDIDTHSPDLYTTHDGTGKAKNGIQISNYFFVYSTFVDVLSDLKDRLTLIF